MKRRHPKRITMPTKKKKKPIVVSLPPEMTEEPQAVDVPKTKVSEVKKDIPKKLDKPVDDIVLATNELYTEDQQAKDVDKQRVDEHQDVNVEQQLQDDTMLGPQEMVDTLTNLPINEEPPPEMKEDIPALPNEVPTPVDDAPSIQQTSPPDVAVLPVEAEDVLTLICKTVESEFITQATASMENFPIPLFKEVCETVFTNCRKKLRLPSEGTSNDQPKEFLSEPKEPIKQPSAPQPLQEGDSVTTVVSDRVLTRRQQRMMGLKNSTPDAPTELPTLYEDTTMSNIFVDSLNEDSLLMEEKKRKRRHIKKPSVKTVTIPDLRLTVATASEMYRLKEEIVVCSALLYKLKHIEGNEIFRDPVDPIQLGILDYYAVIQHPMDLSTISNKLRKGQYANKEEFADDVHLMYNNATMYNHPETYVHQIAAKSLKVFNTLYSKVFEERESSTVHVKSIEYQNSHYMPIGIQATYPHSGFYYEDEVEAQKMRELLRRYSETKSSPLAIPDCTNMQKEIPLSVYEKETILDHIMKISEDHTEELLEMLNITKTPGNVYSIDFNECDDSLLRVIDKIVTNTYHVDTLKEEDSLECLPPAIEEQGDSNIPFSN